MLSYDEYMNMLQEDTREYVNKLLFYLNKVYIKHIKIGFKNPVGNKEISENILLLLSLYALTDMPKYSEIGRKFNKELIGSIGDFPYKFYSDDKEKTFNYFKDLFLIYNNDYDYLSLTPLELLNSIIKKQHYDKGNVIDILFGSEDNFFYLLNMIDNDSILEKKQHNDYVKDKVFNGLSLDVVNYLITASKIKNSLNLLNNDFPFNEDDYTVLSLYLAIYYCKNEDCELIKSIISKYSSFNIDSLNLDLNNSDYNINYIYSKYSKYCKSKLFESKNELSIHTIFYKLFEDDIDGNRAICYLLGIDKSKYDDLKNELENSIYTLEDLNNILKNITGNNKEFVILTCKIYSLIKLQSNTYNKELITNDNDILVLSIYIANCYYDSIINKYFTEYGNVTLDKVLKLVNIDIEDTLLDSSPLSIKPIIKVRKILPTFCDIESLCTRVAKDSISKSNILTECFNKISDTKISNDFSSDMEEYFENKEEERKQCLERKILGNMPLETRRFFINVSRMHNYLLLQKPDLPKEDVKIYSLLLTSLGFENETAEYLKSKNISINSILSPLLSTVPVGLGTIITLQEKDIDIINDNYIDLINQDINLDSLTIFDVIKKAVQDKKYSVELETKLLKYGNICIDYDDFIIHKKALDYLSRAKSDEKNKNINFIKKALRINQRIINYYKDNNIIVSDTFEDISIIISLLLSNENDYQNFCIKNGLSLENILNYYNIPILDFTNLDEEIEDRLLLDNYSKYLDEDYTYISVIKKVISISKVLQEIVRINGGSYKILQNEIITGKEYIPTLSEKIYMLEQFSFPFIEGQNISEIMTFGNNLTLHSKYISDEVSDLILKDNSSKAVESIKDIMGKVQVKEQKKKTLFERLFLFGEEDNIFSIDYDAFNELKSEIDGNILVLSKELLIFDKIRIYIELYQRKNNECLLVVRKKIQELEQELEEDDYINMLNANTIINILKAKEQRFMTSTNLMNQELLKINQIICNHFTIINTLEMARDDMLPLIGTEAAISIGLNSEKDKLELANDIINLFNALLDRNNEELTLSLEKIRSLGINNEITTNLNNDYLSYLSNNNKVKVKEIKKHLKIKE